MKKRYQGKEQLKEDIRAAILQASQKHNQIQYNAQGAAVPYTSHRVSCKTCREAVTVKGLCSQGMGLWEAMMGKPPQNLIK